MDRLEIEKLAEKVYKLRKDKRIIEEKERYLKNEIVDHLINSKKFNVTIGDFIIEYKPKTFKLFKKDKEIPKEYFETKKAYQLFIKKKNDITLEGNKFIVK